MIRPGTDQLVAVAGSILDRADYGFLITPSHDGPDARLVKHLMVDDGFVLWFGTSAYSRKAQRIGDGVPAAYAVEDKAEYAYVTLKGVAAVVSDIGERRRRWQDGLTTFFPDGPGSDDFTLIRLEPYRIELMSFAAKVHPPPLGLVPAVIIRDGDRWVETNAERHEQ